MNQPEQLNDADRVQIAEILSRRANEIAGYAGDHREKLPASVDLALTREIERLRRLAIRVSYPAGLYDPEDA